MKKNAIAGAHLLTVTVEHDGVTYTAILDKRSSRVQLQVNGARRGSCEWARPLINGLDEDIPESVFDLIEQAVTDAGGPPSRKYGVPSTTSERGES